jgi:SAM-dependent methyltransferase
MFSLFQEMDDAKLYAATCHNVTAGHVTKLLSEYINSMSWKTGDRVLDLGCGPGIMTTQVLMPRLPEDFGLLVGADLSADMIQYASKTYEHSKLRFTQFDLTKDIGNSSQLRASDFDKIFSFFCLNWIPEQRYYWAIKPGFHSQYTFIALLKDIFTVLTHMLSFRRFEGTYHLRNVGNYLPLSTA